MKEATPVTAPRQIIFSCYTNRSREGEQFVPDHVLSYQIAGDMQLSNGDQVHKFKEGDIRFVRRNQLVKFVKHPPGDAAFKSLSVYLNQQTLQQLSIQFGYKATGHSIGKAVLEIKPAELISSYIDSLKPYENAGGITNPDLLRLKVTEAVLVLLQTDPVFYDILFDFTEPGKIDLENFMNRHFHFNVQLQRFAYLTGRSLATFKRDFGKIFHDSPSRWLQQKRLEEAHFLIKDKGRTVSDVYLELGFEDISHFSFAFKKKYGIAPSRI